jgi:hypothetical protein
MYICTCIYINVYIYNYVYVCTYILCIYVCINIHIDICILIYSIILYHIGKKYIYYIPLPKGKLHCRNWPPRLDARASERSASCERPTSVRSLRWRRLPPDPRPHRARRRSDTSMNNNRPAGHTICDWGVKSNMSRGENWEALLARDSTGWQALLYSTLNKVRPHRTREKKHLCNSAQSNCIKPFELLKWGTQKWNSVIFSD